MLGRERKGIPEGKLEAQGGECNEAGLVPRRVGKGASCGSASGYIDADPQVIFLI